VGVLSPRFSLLEEPATPSVKLTKPVVARLRAPDPSGKQVLHWDSELRGFGVLCSGTTSGKTYICQRTISRGARLKRFRNHLALQRLRPLAPPPHCGRVALDVH